jgi:hypothetical protein
VMQYMRLRDSVCQGSPDPSSDGPKVSEEAAVEGGEGAAREGELGGAVVRDKRIGMLKECD